MSTSLKILSANEIAEAMAKSLGDEKFMGLYRKASVKNAGGALDAYRVALDQASSKQDLDEAWSSYVNSVAQEEGSTDEMLKLQAEKARELGLPGYSSPADDQMAQPAVDEDELSRREGDLDAFRKVRSIAFLGRAPQPVMEWLEEYMKALEARMSESSTPENLADEMCSHDGDKCPEGCKCGCQSCGDGMMADDPVTVIALDFAMNNIVKVADVLDKRGFAGVASILDETLEKLAAKKKKDDDENAWEDEEKLRDALEGEDYQNIMNEEKRRSLRKDIRPEEIEDDGQFDEGDYDDESRPLEDWEKNLAELDNEEQRKRYEELMQNEARLISNLTKLSSYLGAQGKVVEADKINKEDKKPKKGKLPPWLAKSKKDKKDDKEEKSSKKK